MTDVRLLVTGSRQHNDRRMIEQALYDFEVNLPSQYDWTEIVLVHGAAAGADSIAADVATLRGWRVEAHPADWGQYGKRAGYLRNKEMLDSGVDYVIAFPIGESKGTRMMMNLALEAGVPVRVWEA